MAQSQRKLAKATAEQVEIMKEQLNVAKKKVNIMEDQSEMAIMTESASQLIAHGSEYILLRQKRKLEEYKKLLELEDRDER
ncbi:hypothetical protein GN244_ATG18859 [Phytophthora infestans]|uniref:No apical meristem-associated C-terminal domain-containing protein n=1 Tax=Phytophthora infestans TaxID=4787 RepID=A0A833VUL1_PHYIN|nr:hypothetical protein GN244_ATG18859 [Phytophthora infestans]KAF4138130.1 hypothetical protein GN958_ATG12739 [Phytophthora infestans]